jgi:hypothetical protein
MTRVLAILVLIIFVVALSWVFKANDLAQTKFFAPKYEQVRRETFEQSKAYRQGAIQELQNMEFQYYQVGKNEKAALASIILHRAADFEDLPPDLRVFINELKEQYTK